MANKAKEQADIIINIGLLLLLLDTDYLREYAKRIKEKASFNLSAIVLNPNYLIEESELMDRQAEAILLLCEYKDKLKAIDGLKLKISKEKEGRKKIEELFK